MKQIDSHVLMPTVWRAVQVYAWQILLVSRGPGNSKLDSCPKLPRDTYLPDIQVDFNTILVRPAK